MSFLQELVAWFKWQFATRKIDLSAPAQPYEEWHRWGERKVKGETVLR